MLYDDDDDHDNDDVAPIYDWNWFFGQQLTRFKRVHFSTCFHMTSLTFTIRKLPNYEIFNHVIDRTVNEKSLI